MIVFFRRLLIRIGKSLPFILCGLVMLSCIDNLVKGASGQAIQNMNIILGIDETLGLRHYGLHP